MAQLTKFNILKILYSTLLDLTVSTQAFEQFLKNVKQIGPGTTCVHPCKVAETVAFLIIEYVFSVTL